jgi:hypothetical protein
MEFTVESLKQVSRAKTKTAASQMQVGGDYAVEEINAYIAVRDELLREAERTRSRAKLDSVKVANNFIVGCLRPSRGLYASQCLPENDAVRERERCASIDARLAELSRSAVD